MSVSPQAQLPRTNKQSDYKIGTYFVAGKLLYHINYITNDYILLENCYNNQVESFQMDTFLKTKKRIVSVDKQYGKEVIV